MTGASGASVTGPLPKWQLALAVAAPVALGLGYMYYKNSSKPSSKPSRGKSKNSKKNGAPATDKQISIDIDCPPKSTTETEVRKILTIYVLSLAMYNIYFFKHFQKKKLIFNILIFHY